MAMKCYTLVMLVGIMILFAAAASANGLNTAQDDQLILWLDFDTEDVIDLSPKKTVLSGITPGAVVEGLVGNAWQFEEGTRMSILGQSFSVPFDESTFSVWVLRSGDKGVVYEEGGGTNGHCVQILNGELQFCTRDGGAATCIQAEFPTNDDQWHFITTVFNKGVMMIYIDGEMVADKDGVPGIGSHANETGIGNVGLPTIGTSCSQDAGQWTGVMDQFAIARRVATAQEIKEEYESSGKISIEAIGKMAITWGNVKAAYIGRGNSRE